MAAAALLVAGCGTTTSSRSVAPPSTVPAGTPAPTAPSTPTAGGTGGKPSWIVADWAIADMEKAGLSQSLVTSFFDNPETYLILHPGDARIDAALPHAVRLERFTSFATMQSAFADGQLLPGISAVMYDNEAWSFTPADEKANPIQFAAEAAALAHQHDLRLVFTPAANLADLQSSATGGDKYANYLAQDLAAGARVSDVFDIQSQQAEGTPQFATFVSQAAGQAKAANPGAVVMAGIGPNPGGRPVTAAQILDAVDAVRSEVSGFWLNMPAGTAQCPQCGTAQPQVAVAFLEALAAQLGIGG